jgi:hypothetical protein
MSSPPLSVFRDNRRAGGSNLSLAKSEQKLQADKPKIDSQSSQGLGYAVKS